MNFEKLLMILEKNNGEYVSGQALATQLGVTRASIWKMMKALQEKGYNIESKTNKGYALILNTDILNADKIKQGLKTKWLGQNIEIFSTLDSTNTYLRNAGYKGCKNGTVVIAECQTHGKGRRGKEFASPGKNGIYMSLLLRTNVPIKDIQLLTILAAVAVRKGIFDLTGTNVDIKWVNDILFNGKKLCGILTEGAVNGETGTMDFAVVGIGINVVNTDTIKNDFSDIVCALNEIVAKKVERCHLISQILNCFEYYYELYIESGDVKEILREYKSGIVMMGKRVRIVQGDNEFFAIAKDIDTTGGLMVEKESGEQIIITSGQAFLAE